MGIFVPSSFIFKTNKTSINVTTVESEESQWKHFPSVELTVAETSLEPSSSSVEEGDMQMYLLGRKHCPRPWILRGRHNFSKSQQQRQRSREIQFELELGHAFFDLGMMLCRCWFSSGKKKEHSANFIGQHFVLITEPWGTWWRHNTGKSWKLKFDSSLFNKQCIRIRL